MVKILTRVFVCILLLNMNSGFAELNNNYIVFAPARNDGKVKIFQMNSATGIPTKLSENIISGQPSVLASDPRNIVSYVDQESSNRISSEANPHTGDLTDFNSVLVLGVPTSMSTDKTGKYLLSQNELKIAGISNNQEVSGSVIVELQSVNLSDYKKVSYCIDGELLQNVYEHPFAVEFDSRDFENGKHELSVRGILTSERQKCGIVYTDAVNIQINNPAQPFKILIKNPRKMVSAEQNNYRNNYIDNPHTVIKKNDSALYFFNHMGLLKSEREKRGIYYRSTGTLEQPIETIESGNYLADVWNKNGHPTQGIWLMGAYRIGTNELLGFTHNESCYYEDKPCTEDAKFFSQGIGYSQDNGKTWLYCGDILRTGRYEPRFGKGSHANIGGMPYILKDGYFYVYFGEFPGQEEDFYPGVARAKIADVIAAARKGKNVEWKKYNNGEWDQDGLTGLGSNFMSNLDIPFNMHAKATYVPSIRKYLMITFSHGKVKRDIYLLSSDDGLKWEIAEKIIDHNSTLPVSYPFFADFYSDDCHEVDNDFYIYWARNYRDLWGARVIIKLDTK